MATNGNFSNPGTIDQPFVQLKQFSDIANPGDTLYIRGGTYTDSWGTTMTRSGSATGGYITYRNYGNEVPILDGQNDSNRQSVCFYHYSGDSSEKPLSYVRIQGLVIRNWKAAAIEIGGTKEGTHLNTGAHHIDIRYNLVDQCGRNGITFFQSNDITIQYNVVGRTGYDANMGSWSSNINLYNMTGTNNLVDGNVAYQGIDVSYHHTDGNGIILDRSSLHGLNGGMKATNNICFWNGGAGIAVTTSGNATMYNNTLWENGKESTYINGPTGYVSWDTGDNIIFRNNIAYQSSGTGGIRLDKSYPNSSFTNNNASGQSGSSDPKFIDPWNANFALQSSSPSLNAGISNGAPSNSIGFDYKAIKVQTTDQPVSWFRFAPDIAYVQGKGGLEKCFSPVSRPQGGGYDQGAYEAGSSTPTTDSVNSFTAPSSVSPGQSVTVTVNYTTTTNRKIRVMLLNPNNNWSWHGGTDVNVSAGSGTQNVNVAVVSSTPNGSSYVWQAQILDANGNYITGQQQNNVTVGTATGPGGRYAQAATDGRYYAGNMSQYINVAANTDYKACVYVKGSGAIMLRVLPTSWASNLNSVRCNASGSWTKYEFTFNSGSNTQVVFSLDDAYGTTGTVQIDNCGLARTSGDTTNLIANSKFDSGSTSWNVRSPFSVP